MDGTLIQHWQVGYLLAGLLFACATIVACDHLRTGDPPSKTIRCGVAVTAGTLWPVVAIGLLQLWFVELVVHHMRHPHPRPAVAVLHRHLVGSGSR